VIDPAELHTTNEMYRIPKKDKHGKYSRPLPNKKSGFFTKGSEGKKAKELHPQNMAKHILHFHRHWLGEGCLHRNYNSQCDHAY